MRKPNRATRTAAGALLLFCGLRLLVRHGCGSGVDVVVVIAGDRRIVRSIQPAATDRRPPARGAAVPERTNLDNERGVPSDGSVLGRARAADGDR